MKKVYIMPQAKAITLDASEIIAQSAEQMSFRGSNRGTGITSAEVKGSRSWDDEDEEEW